MRLRGFCFVWIDSVFTINAELGLDKARIQVTSARQAKAAAKKCIAPCLTQGS